MVVLGGSRKFPYANRCGGLAFCSPSTSAGRRPAQIPIRPPFPITHQLGHSLQTPALPHPQPGKTHSPRVDPERRETSPPPYLSLHTNVSACNSPIPGTQARKRKQMQAFVSIFSPIDNCVIHNSSLDDGERVTEECRRRLCVTGSRDRRRKGNCAL